MASMAFACGIPASAILFGSMMEVFTVPDETEALNQAITYGIAYFVLASVYLITTVLQGWMFAKSGQMLTERIRIMMFGSILKQEMGWFDDDKNSTGR